MLNFGKFFFQKLPRINIKQGNTIMTALVPNCEIKFPIENKLPKIEIQQKQFLQKYPEYDGRNIIMAILDTGVDPALPGMQVTSTGKAKLIGCMDLTGAGDVDMSTTKIESDGKLIGLSGRTLNIPPKWENPTRKYHLGIKPIYELLSKSLKNRITRVRREEFWDPMHPTAISEVIKKIDTHELQIGGVSEKLSDKYDREDLNYRLEYLKNMDKAEDLGPVADCLVWHDGKKWRACLDVSYRGRLSMCEVLTNYADERKYGVLSEKDMLSYCVTIHDEGNLLEISVPSGTHGSHVANIAAAYFPEDTQENGIAPGAQVISMNIGDSRLGGMETGQALIRAFYKCAELGVDVVNYSFGERVHFIQTGKIIKALEEMVFKKSITFVSVAGNDGPALSTIISPCISTSAVFSAAAFLSPEMVEAIYTVLDNQIPENVFPFSSRGPTIDGSLGMSVCAPGGAITGVPKYTLACSQRMNGTSMASPSLCGAIACLMSAMKAKSLPISPLRVRLAIENSAKMPVEVRSNGSEKLEFGQGLVQLERAFDHVQLLESVPSSLNIFEVNVSEANPKVPTTSSSRGIYIRETYQCEPTDFMVRIQPKFKDVAESTEKVNYQRHIALRTNANYVQCPETLVLTNQNCDFQVHVNPTALIEDSVNFTEILGYDIKEEKLGPLFRIPITVIVPKKLDKTSGYRENWTLDLKRGVPNRNFIDVPKEAVWAQYKLKSHNKNRLSQYIIHLMQSIPQTSFDYTEHQKYITLDPDGEEVGYFKVRPGYAMEVCLTKAWHHSGDNNKVNFEISFHGAGPTSLEPVTFVSTDAYHKLTVKNEIRLEEISPAVTFRHQCQPLKPSEAKIKSLGARDLSTDGKQTFCLTLIYPFNVTKTLDYEFHFPGLTNFLYESPFESIHVQVFTASKKFIAASNSYPNRYVMKLEKGDGYKAIVQFRCQSLELLELYKDVALVMKQKLTQAISLDAYSTANDALSIDGRKIGSFILRPGQNRAIYFASIPDDKMPKHLTAGSYFTGTYCFAKADNETLRKNVQFPIKYVISEWSSKRHGKNLSTVEVAKKKQDAGKFSREDFENSLRDHEIQILSKVTDKEYANELYQQLSNKYPSHLPLLLAELKRLTNAKADELPLLSAKILAISEHILDVAKPDEVQMFYGAKIEHSEQDLLVKEDMEKRKAAIIEALFAKANIVADAHLKISTQSVPNIFRKGLHYHPDGAQIKGPSENKDTIEDESSEEEESEDSQKTDVATPGDPNLVELPEELQQQLEEVNESLAADSEATDKKISESSANFEQYQPKLDELDMTYNHLLKWLPDSDPKALFISAKHAVAHAHLGIALRSLQKILDDKGDTAPASLPISTAIIELTDLLGWVHVANNLRNSLLVKHRSTYRPF